MVTVFVFEIIRQTGHDLGTEIKQQVKQAAHVTKDAGKSKYGFEAFAEGIQGNHVESQVHGISMNKAMRDEAVKLLPLADGRRIKDQVIDHLLLAEGTDGNKAGDDDKNERNG